MLEIIGHLMDESLLKLTLDRLYGDFNYPDSAADPIQIVRRFEQRSALC